MTAGTVNGGDRGSSYARRTRKRWLVETFRADVDLLVLDGVPISGYPVERGRGAPACRCYRCGTLLTADTVSPDRIKPGVEGGTYRRDNLRPSCLPCQYTTGNEIKRRRRG